MKGTVFHSAIVHGILVFKSEGISKCVLNEIEVTNEKKDDLIGFVSYQLRNTLKGILASILTVRGRFKGLNPCRGANEYRL